MNNNGISIEIDELVAMPLKIHARVPLHFLRSPFAVPLQCHSTFVFELKAIHNRLKRTLDFWFND